MRGLRFAVSLAAFVRRSLGRSFMFSRALGEQPRLVAIA